MKIPRPVTANVGSSSATPGMISSITEKPQMNNIANNLAEHAKPINDSLNSTKINGANNLTPSVNTTTISSNTGTTDGNILNNNTSDVNKENIPTPAFNGQQPLRTAQKANAPNIPTKEEPSQVTSTISHTPVSNSGAPSANSVITSTNQTGPKHNTIQQASTQLSESQSGSGDQTSLDPSSVIISTTQNPTPSSTSNTSIPENKNIKSTENSPVDQVQQQVTNTVMSTSSSSSSSNATTLGGGVASSVSSGTTTSNSYRLSNFETNNDSLAQNTEVDNQNQLQKPNIVLTAKTNAPLAPTTGRIMIIFCC